MNCQDAERDMVLSYYGDLDVEAQRALQAHCENCPACFRKAADVRAELGEITHQSGARPEFDWDKSWRAIQARVAGPALARSRRSLPARRLLSAAAGLGIFILGLVVGRHVLRTPAPDFPSRPPDGKIMALLLQHHLGEAELALWEVANCDPAESGRTVLEFEKERARSLRFRNRTLRTMVGITADPALAPLLNDLEIILYEAANLDVGTSEAVRRIKTLIRDKEILFRIRHLKAPRGPIPGQKELL